MSGARRESILVVDDDPRNVRLLLRILDLEGFQTRSAEDGCIALDHIARDRPDLVLLDVMMPGLDGFEVCRRLRAAPATRDLPVLLVTALGDPAEKVVGLESGADDFLTKPIDRAELLARVRAHLRLKHLRDELVSSEEALAGQNRKLVELERLRQDFTHMLVHDLKGPLAAIRLTVEFLRALDPAPRAQRLDAALEHVHTCAARLEAMVGDVLDVARIEQAAPALKPRPFAWAEVCAGALRQAGALVSAQEKVAVEVRPGAELFVGDPGLIERVLVNLLTNAMRLDPGGPVEVLVEADGDAVRLTVADRGPGVPEEMRDAIFDKFATVEARRQGRLANHGLGLAFCKMAVEAHGGSIWVEPRVEGGSRFCLRLPLPEAASAPVPALLPAPLATSNA